MAPSGKTPYATVIMGNGFTYYIWVDDSIIAEFSSAQINKRYDNWLKAAFSGNSNFIVHASISKTEYDEVTLHTDEIDSFHIGLDDPPIALPGQN
mgnify:CR=1 FL=1